MPIFRDLSSINRTGENGLRGSNQRVWPRFSLEPRCAVRLSELVRANIKRSKTELFANADLTFLFRVFALYTTPMSVAKLLKHALARRQGRPFIYWHLEGEKLVFGEFSACARLLEF